MYDAFGNEKNPSSTDTNPFRYCGEYYDTATGLYYLRARYYDPAVGRFTQRDTHWNTANMIYGDNPQKINEREDALGVKTYSYTPQISAVVQSGNLYVYAINNPVMYADPNGKQVVTVHFDENRDFSLRMGNYLLGAAVTAMLIDILTADDPPILYAKKGTSEGKRTSGTAALAGSSPASPDPDDDGPNSPNHVKEKWLERNQIDSHGFKKDVIKQLNKEGYNLSTQVSKYDIYKDSSTGRIWLKVKETGRWLSTNETWFSLVQYYSGF